MIDHFLKDQGFDIVHQVAKLAIIVTGILRIYNINQLMTMFINEAMSVNEAIKTK
ncbi:hypothetical protein MCAV_05510 [[Mycoplasma] cavipharyngis]|uniref:hypothetical protein n=1 Tax=[Mycoplasma] cavipharyngis TaxID=92757 RepID=UPI00370435C7